MDHIRAIFLNGTSLASFCLLSSFQINNTIFTRNICEKCPSNIWCQDLNTRLSVHESPPITTRPGLRLYKIFNCQKRFGPHVYVLHFEVLNYFDSLKSKLLFIKLVARNCSNSAVPTNMITLFRQLNFEEVSMHVQPLVCLTGFQMHL